MRSHRPTVTDVKPRFATSILLTLGAALLMGPPMQAQPVAGPWELRILHASDQEAGKKALLDIAGMVAVMEKLERLPYANTLKLTSGDLFIAGPFMNASQVLYSQPNRYQKLKLHQRTLEPLAMRPGIADIIINSNLGWQAAVIGNHEFDGVSQSDGILNQGNFFELIAADPTLRNYDGHGIGKDAKAFKQPGAGIGSKGYQGAAFPYLSVNLDFTSFKANRQGQSIFKAYGLKDATGAPQPASPTTLARSTVLKVGDSQIGVIGATTPFLPDIVGGLTAANMLPGSYRSKETPISEQAMVLKPLISREVEALQRLGINKIILLTHLQDSAVEQELSQQLVDNHIGIDVVIGGGSHKVMGPADGSTRGLLRGLNQSSVIEATAKAKQQVVPALIPYPQIFVSKDQRSSLAYVNAGANYEYLGQLVVRFDGNGKLISHDPINSRPWRTDGAGVSRMLGKPEWLNLSAFEQNKRIKQHILNTTKNGDYRNAIATLDAVENYINSLDRLQYGRSTVWLNGNNADVRSRETNLGNLLADALLWYGQQLHQGGQGLKDIPAVDVAFINGGGIRDMIGTEQVMPDEAVHREPPEANPELGKQNGEISKLDILNSLRFDNTLTIGTITAAQLKRSAEAMVAESRHGGFGQISGFRFRYDPNKAKGQRVMTMDLMRPVRRADGRIDGRSQRQELVRPLVRQGRVLNPDEQLGLVTITYLAEGGDGQGGAQLTQHLRNVHWIGTPGDVTTWRNLGQLSPQLLLAAEANPRISTNAAQRELGFGSYRDALGAYLSAHHGPDNPLAAPDPLTQPGVQPSRILTEVTP